MSLFNGNLIFEHQDTSSGGTLLPVSVRHVYNSCYGPVNPFGLGYGWTTNCHQALRKETISGRLYYVWVDEDGTEVYFAQQDGRLEGSDRARPDADAGRKRDDHRQAGLPARLCRSHGEFAGDWSHVCMLLRMEDAVGNAIVPLFSGRTLNSMTDGAGRATAFLLE